jgi:hypothetical protein
LCCPALLRTCGNHSGEAERSYGIGLKLFGFIPEPVFTFIPESCSGSSRNTVRNHPGIAFILPRIPHQVRNAASPVVFSVESGLDAAEADGPRKRIILKRRSRRLVCGYVRRNTRLRPVEASQFRPCRPGSRASLAGLISERRPGFPKAIGIESPHPAPGALPLQHGSAYLLTWILPPVPPPGPGRAPPPLETSLTHSEPSPL